MTDAIDLKAIEAGMNLRRHDAYVRRVVDMCVGQALNEHAEPSEYDYRRFAHDVATLATTTLLQHIYVDDGEIRRLRAERDAYKAIAERLMITSPSPMVISAICDPKPNPPSPESDA